MLTFEQGVTLVGGGPAPIASILDAQSFAPVLVAADGGANRLLDAELIPLAILGDLDSLDDPAAWRSRIGDKLIKVEDQNSTDFEKCLMWIRAPFFVCVGFLGGRQDHTLAALHALIADPRPIVLIGDDDAAFAPQGETRLSLPVGERISFFPLREVTARRGAGLAFPIDGLTMEAGAQIGTSNEASAPEQFFAFDRPGAIVLLNSDRARDALRAQGALFQPPI